MKNILIILLSIVCFTVSAQTTKHKKVKIDEILEFTVPDSIVSIDGTKTLRLTKISDLAKKIPTGIIKVSNPATESISGDSITQQKINQENVIELAKKSDREDLNLNGLVDTTDKPDAGNALPFLAPDGIQNYALIATNTTNADFVRMEKLDNQTFDFSSGYNKIVEYPTFAAFGASFTRTNSTTITANASITADFEVSLLLQATNVSPTFPADITLTIEENGVPIATAPLLPLVDNDEKILNFDLPSFAVTNTLTYTTRISVNNNGNNSAVVKILGSGSNIFNVNNPANIGILPIIPKAYIEDGGDFVTKTGTPATPQIAVWDSDGIVKAVPGFSYNAGILDMSELTTMSISTFGGVLVDYNDGTGAYRFGDNTFTINPGGHSSFVGNLGVGVVTPTQTLEVFSSTTDQLLSLGAFEFRAISNYGTSKNLFYHRQDVNQLVVNEEGVDLDFRIESINDANLFKADAGRDQIGIGTDAPTAKLDIIGLAKSSATIGEIDAEGDEALITKEYADITYSPVAAHGGLGFENNATGTVIASAGTYVKIAGTTSPTIMDQVSHTDNRLTYTGTETVHFTLIAYISFVSSVSNDIISFKFAKNGTVVGFPATEKIGTGTDIRSVAIFYDLNLATNDFIELFATDETTTSTITVEDLYMSIEGD